MESADYDSDVNEYNPYVYDTDISEQSSEGAYSDSIHWRQEWSELLEKYYTLYDEFAEYARKYPSPSPAELERRSGGRSEFEDPADIPIPGVVDASTQTNLITYRTTEDVQRLLEDLPKDFWEYPWNLADWSDVEAVVYELPHSLFQDFNGPLIEPRAGQLSEDSSDYRTAPSSPTIEASLPEKEDYIQLLLPTIGV